jgi:hypothetical protein
MRDPSPDISNLLSSIGNLYYAADGDDDMPCRTERFLSHRWWISYDCVAHIFFSDYRIIERDNCRHLRNFRRNIHQPDIPAEHASIEYWSSLSRRTKSERINYIPIWSDMYLLWRCRNDYSNELSMVYTGRIIAKHRYNHNSDNYLV